MLRSNEEAGDLELVNRCLGPSNVDSRHWRLLSMAECKCTSGGLHKASHAAFHCKMRRFA